MKEDWERVWKSRDQIRGGVNIGGGAWAEKSTWLRDWFGSACITPLVAEQMSSERNYSEKY